MRNYIHKRWGCIKGASAKRPGLRSFGVTTIRFMVVQQSPIVLRTSDGPQP